MGGCPGPIATDSRSLSSVDAIVRAEALRWVSDDQPGWIEVAIVDGEGAEHRIVEKVPVLTRHDFTSASTYPSELWLEVEARRVEGDRVQVRLVHGVETTEGLTGVTVLSHNVRWL